MKKIMIAIDAEKPDQHSIAFGIYLARITHSELTGIFLEGPQAIRTPGLKFAYGSVVVETIDEGPEPEIISKNRACLENIRKFKEACETHGIPYRIHRDQHSPEDGMIAESRYADVIITGAAVFGSSAIDVPSGFVKALLARSECPVVIAPNHPDMIDKIFFAYDGKASSVFAIKQFTYLFPELKEAALVVLQANEEGIFDEKQKEKVYEYLKDHYSRIDFKDLPGKPIDELFDYTLHETKACLVMGAFGRNWLSSVFKISTADLVIQVNSLPVFITHKAL